MLATAMGASPRIAGHQLEPGNRSRLATTLGLERSRREQPPSAQRISWVSWTRLPAVSFSMAIFDIVTSVGGIVNSAPRAFMRS
jgi:hypothetical protein